MTRKLKQSGRPELTAAHAKALKKQLTWREDAGYDVEVVFGPTPQTPRSRWRVKVLLGDRLAVHVDQPVKGKIVLDTGARGRGGRQSTGESDICGAIAFAEEWLAQEQLELLQGAKIEAALDRGHDSITVGNVADLFPRTKYARTKSARKYQLAVRVAEHLFGRTFPVRKITTKRLEAAIAAREAGIPELGLGPCEPATSVPTFKDFNSVLRAIGNFETENGEEYKKLHPSLVEERTWPAFSKRRREASKKDAFNDLMRPHEVMKHDGTFVTVAPPVDQADPSGQLRCLLAVVNYTGRRFESALRLRASDFIRDKSIMRHVLREAGEVNGLSSSDWSDHFDALLNFRPEWDKEGYWFPIPIHHRLIAEIELYLRRSGVTEGPLFPSELKSGSPITQSCISKRPHRRSTKSGEPGRISVGRYDKAVLIACDLLERRGNDPAEVFPVHPRTEDPHRLIDLDPIYRWDIRKGYKLHRDRSRFATEMARLGYGGVQAGNGNAASLDAHVDYIGSWLPAGMSVKHQRYIHLDPVALQAVANWENAFDALADIAAMAAKQAEHAGRGADEGRKFIEAQIGEDAGSKGAA